MEVQPSRTGRSWRVYAHGIEVGVVTIPRVRTSRAMFAPWSAIEDGRRWELGIAYTLEDAVERIAAFDPSEPGVFVRIDAAVVDRRLT